jgi:hypothetical protein
MGRRYADIIEWPREAQNWQDVFLPSTVSGKRSGRDNHLTGLMVSA